jgi:hypothetical protein
MTAVADLERAYRGWLRWYPKSFRRQHEAELLGVLMAGAREGQRHPGRMERVDLVRSALCMRLRPRVPRSDRATLAAIRLMYLGATAELAVGLTILATLGDVKASILGRDPGYSPAQWHAEVAGTLEPLVAAAALAVGFWLWMAWATGRGHRWVTVLVALFFCATTYSLLHGLVGGSAHFARVDLVAGTVLWVVELAAVGLVSSNELRRMARNAAVRR